MPLTMFRAKKRNTADEHGLPRKSNQPTITIIMIIYKHQQVSLYIASASSSLSSPSMTPPSDSSDHSAASFANDKPE